MNALNELDGQAFLILEQYKKAYVSSHLEPDNPDYQDAYAKAEESLTSIQSKLFSLSKDAKNGHEALNTQLNQLNAEIARERKRHTKLSKALGKVEHKQLASEDLISDYEEIYQHLYLRNWALALSTLVALYALSFLRAHASNAH